jgi:hypothetical protein
VADQSLFEFNKTNTFEAGREVSQSAVAEDSGILHIHGHAAHEVFQIGHFEPEMDVLRSFQVSFDSSIVIAIRSGLDGPGIETRPDRPWGPPSLLYNGYRVSFQGVKRPGRGVDHPPPPGAEVKEQSYTSTSPLGLDCRL